MHRLPFMVLTSGGSLDVTTVNVRRAQACLLVRSANFTRLLEIAKGRKSENAEGKGAEHKDTKDTKNEHEGKRRNRRSAIVVRCLVCVDPCVPVHQFSR